MAMRMKKLQPRCNLSTIKDGRGGVFTFVPVDAPIAEFSLIFTEKGKTRGFHYHEEFDEYVLLLDGHGVYVEKGEDGEEYFLKMASGECVHFPRMTPHTFYAITDARMVALLTGRWDECRRPFVRIDD
jgi:oxalate decarboxylase/phosphoglucose isomerase-like protein (cupin superfamily)